MRLRTSLRRRRRRLQSALTALAVAPCFSARLGRSMSWRCQSPLTRPSATLSPLCGARALMRDPSPACGRGCREAAGEGAANELREKTRVGGCLNSARQSGVKQHAEARQVVARHFGEEMVLEVVVLIEQKK